MNTKTSLAIILTAMLLADSFHGLKWQGTGSGMNNTVITEIWAGLETNFLAALRGGGIASLTKELSDRLNARWNPAWNVFMMVTLSEYDAVVYGYAFKNQWMWYNGVPNPDLGTNFIGTIIVWKDYNCQDWKSISDYGSSSFDSIQKNYIKS